MNKKTKLILFLFVNLYCFSFFLWYRPVEVMYFADEYKPNVLEGRRTVTVFLPFCESGDYNRAGAVSRLISCSYLPLAWLWEKKGLGIFCFDEIDIQGLKDMESNNESEQH